MIQSVVFANKSISLTPTLYVLGQFYNGGTHWNLAAKEAIRKIKCFPPFLIPEKLTLGMEAFSADDSMAELFDSAAAACQPSKSFVRPFSNNLTPWPWELHSSSSDYFREQVLKQMLYLCAEVQLWDTFPEWCHTGVSCSFLVLIWCNGFLRLCISDGNATKMFF